MAKSKKVIGDNGDEDTAPAETAEIPPGGSGGSAGYVPVGHDDFLTTQDQAGLDKSIGGGKPEEKVEEKAAKKAAKE